MDVMICNMCNVMSVDGEIITVSSCVQFLSLLLVFCCHDRFCMSAHLSSQYTTCAMASSN